MKPVSKIIILFIIGGCLYYAIEWMTRQYSHWTMFLLGGLCFVACGLINSLFGWDFPLFHQMVISTVIITTFEFIAGYILNVKLGLDIWNYSDQPLNLMGQICFSYSSVWFFLSCPLILLDDHIRYWFFGEEKPRYQWVRGLPLPYRRSPE